MESVNNHQQKNNEINSEFIIDMNYYDFSNYAERDSSNINSLNQELEVLNHNLKFKLLKEIAIISETKKFYVQRLVLECYTILTEIEEKIQDESVSLEKLILEKIEEEKKIFEFEIENRNFNRKRNFN